MFFHFIISAGRLLDYFCLLKTNYTYGDVGRVDLLTKSIFVLRD